MFIKETPIKVVYNVRDNIYLDILFYNDTQSFLKSFLLSSDKKKIILKKGVFSLNESFIITSDKINHTIFFKNNLITIHLFDFLDISEENKNRLITILNNLFCDFLDYKRSPDTRVSEEEIKLIYKKLFPPLEENSKEPNNDASLNPTS